MARTARLVHHLPGRVRLRIPAGARNTSVLDQIKTSIASVRGVRRVDVNTAIGSLVRLCQIRRLICCSSWMRLK